MKLCVNNYKNLSYTTKKSLQFKSRQVLQNVAEKKVYKKNIPLFFVGLLLCLSSCNGRSDRYSERQNYNGINVEFTEVQQATRDSVLLPVLNLKSKLTKKGDFLNNLKIDIIRSFRGMNVEKDSFKKYLKQNHSTSDVKGMSFYSDKKLKRRIAIQERAHNNYDNDIDKIRAMQQSLMHEVGHQFDNYFGHEHDSEFAMKWDSLQYRKSLSKDVTQYDFYCLSEKEQKIDNEYNIKNELSDKPEFKNAFFEDVKNIKTIMNVAPEKLPKNIGYYISGLDLSKNICKDDFQEDMVNYSEVYANTFSYLMGTDDGEKQLFFNAFPNCKKIVERDIIIHLNIKK